MKISVIVPNYNGGKYLEQCLLSILQNKEYREIRIATPIEEVMTKDNQLKSATANNSTTLKPGNCNYDLELIVIDGGSTDESISIIKKYEPGISYWESDSDEGHYYAVNKGMAKATGDILCWLNSDDMLAKNALSTVANIFSIFPDIDWITGRPHLWDEQGDTLGASKCRAYSRNALRRGEHDSRILQGVQQESCFWRNSLWEKAGGRINVQYSLAGDYDLWTRFAEHAELVAVDAVLSGNRQHPSQRSRLQHEEYFRQVDEICAGLKYRRCIRRFPFIVLPRVRGGYFIYKHFFQQGQKLIFHDCGSTGLVPKVIRSRV